MITLRKVNGKSKIFVKNDDLDLNYENLYNYGMMASIPKVIHIND